MSNLDIISKNLKSVYKLRYTRILIKISSTPTTADTVTPDSEDFSFFIVALRNYVRVFKLITRADNIYK